MNKEKRDFDKVLTIKLASLSDLIRVVSSLATAMQPTYLIAYRNLKGKYVLGFLAVFRDYYELYGVPLFYYIVDDDPTVYESKYVLVRVDENGERIELSKSTRPGYIAIPVIHIEQAPSFLLPLDIE